MDGARLMPARTKSRRHSGIKLPGISKHNEGRKPRYKEHGADSVRHVIVREKEVPGKLIPRTIARAKAPPDVELTESVRRYLAERQIPAVADPKPLVVEHPYEKAESGHNIRDGLENSISSRRDIVIEMYIEKTLRLAELNAARMWQHYIE
jgi:hypothetical protein